MEAQGPIVLADVLMPRDQAEYMREYRQTMSGRAQMQAQKIRARARQMAYRALARKHAIEFEALFAGYLRQLDDQAREDPGLTG